MLYWRFPSIVIYKQKQHQHNLNLQIPQAHACTDAARIIGIEMNKDLQTAAWDSKSTKWMTELRSCIIESRNTEKSSTRCRCHCRQQLLRVLSSDGRCLSDPQCSVEEDRLSWWFVRIWRQLSRICIPASSSTNGWDPTNSPPITTGVTSESRPKLRQTSSCVIWRSTKFYERSPLTSCYLRISERDDRRLIAYTTYRNMYRLFKRLVEYFYMRNSRWWVSCVLCNR